MIFLKEPERKAKGELELAGTSLVELNHMPRDFDRLEGRELKRMDEERSVEMRVGDHRGGTNWVALTEHGVADPPKKGRPIITYHGHGLFLVTTAVLASAY